MMETKVSVKEFSANLFSYLQSLTPLAVTRHGQTVGYYIPVRGGQKQAEIDTLSEVAATLSGMMSALCVSEDDIASDFEAHRTSYKR